jgi:NADPH2:quinone reductase
MRAIVIDKPGGRDRLKLRTVPDPEPARGEVLIGVRYAGMNWSDIQKRQGVYPDPVTYPCIVGLEVSGRVLAKGPGVRRFQVGDRVAATTGPQAVGGYAERVAVPTRYLIPLPDTISDRVGAAFPVVALTAYHLLHSAYRLRKGETMLVHAIGGGVGLMLTQMARDIGARVIGTVSSAAKGRRALKFGAERVVDRGTEDFVAACHDFTGGKGIDLVIDSLGADILERSFDCLRTYGHIINIGEAAGYPKFPIRPKLYENSTSLAGYELLHAKPGSPRWRRGVREVTAAIAQGRLKIPIEGSYPLAQARSAQRHLESRTVSGKLLLKVTSHR